MKKLALSIVLFSTLIITSCSQKKVDTANCKGHERNCPVSENCPEHPECEAHEACIKGEACKHAACMEYEKSKQ